MTQKRDIGMRVPMEIETTVRYTATCRCCGIRISAEYPGWSGKNAETVGDDFAALGWERCRETAGLWICDECAEEKTK